MPLVNMKIYFKVVTATTAGVIGCSILLPSLAAQTSPLLPDKLVVLARQLESIPLTDDDGDATPAPTPGDRTHPAIGLRLVLIKLERLQEAANRETEQPLRKATEAMQEAWRHYASGSRDLSHLGKSADALQQAQSSLHVAASSIPTTARGDIERIQATLSSLAQRMAGDILRVAEKSSASHQLSAARSQFTLGEIAARQGNYTVAASYFGGAVKLAANTITFDVALFEQTITAALAGQTTGHAFSIAYGGQLYQGGESSGVARTSADPPATAQSPGKEMHVASVSKPLTTIVTLRLLDELGLTPDALIAPYLPSDWVLGEGVDQLRFRDFMTHHSGFGWINAGNSYESLQTAIATDVVSQSWNYSNANFGLMRVLVAGLQGIDPVDYDWFDPGALTSAAFILYAQSLYSSIGVNIDCAPNDDTPTVQYKFPDDGTPGYVEPNHQLSCGGFGWFISANELAAVLTYLRNTETLLSASARTAMQEGFLGFMDPMDWDFVVGDFGVYYMHGGDWTHSSEELHSCVVAVPITVEASLVINSARGAMPYQCSVLRSAFDDAWVAK